MKLVISILFFACFTSFASDWPQWLGPTRNNYAAPDDKIPDRLPAELKPIWKIPIGGGFSSPVVANGKMIYFDENGEKEVVHLRDAKTGKEIWQTPIANRYADEWSAGPRSTPFIDGDRVYVQSCNGEFRCLNLADGKILWGASFEKDFGVKFLGSKGGEGTAARRGNNGSGIVDGNAVIVPVGSTNGATLVCFDKFTGKVLWKSGNDEAAYSSLQIATFGDVKQVIVFAADSLMGFARENGKQLWRVPLKTGAKRHAATPVISGDNVIVNSHTIGLVSFKISKAVGRASPRVDLTGDGSSGASPHQNADEFSAAKLWANKNLKINLSTPVLVGNFLYSQGPKGDFVCVDAKNGELKWSQPGFGKENSSVIGIENKLLVLTDAGELVLFSATPEKYSELGRVQACGKNWNFPAYANGKLYVRDARELACFDLHR